MLTPSRIPQLSPLADVEAADAFDEGHAANHFGCEHLMMSSTATALSELRDADLRALIEHARDGIFVADTGGRYTYVNQAACRLLGYAPHERNEIIGKTIMDLIPPEDVERLARVKSRLQRGGTDVGEWSAACRSR
jgi:PAS domain-containing protein